MVRMESPQGKSRRVLLVLQHLGYLKHFENTVRVLTDQGCFVTIIHYKQKEHFSPSVIMRMSKNKKVNIIYLADIISKDSAKLSHKIRRSLDSLQYEKIFYANSPELVERFQPVSKWGVTFPEDFIANLLCKPALTNMLTLEQRMVILSEAFYSSMKPSSKLKRILDKVKPESILISPFLDGDSEPYAFLKYGRGKQIPTTYLMASWDNLQNKGVLMPTPDQYLVWTEEHKKQLIEMHSADKDKIYVVGSEILEIWGQYESKRNNLKKSSKSREIKILYCCSSPFISARKEEELLFKIVNHIDQKNMNGWQIELTIKTHPQVDLIKLIEKLESYCVSDKFITIVNSAQNISDDETSRSDFSRIIQRNDLCVGLTTSILLEAAIQGSTVASISSSFENLHFPKVLHEQFLSKYIIKDVKSIHEFDTLLENYSEYLVPSTELCKKIREDFLVTKNGSVPLRIIEAINLLREKTANTVDAEISKNISILSKNKKQVTLRSLSQTLLSKATYKRIIDILRNDGILSLLRHTNLYFKNLQKISYELAESKLSQSEMHLVQDLMINPICLGDQQLNQDFLNWDTVSVDFRKFKVKTPELYSQIVDESLNRITDLMDGYDNLIFGPWFSELGFELLYWVPLIKKLLTEEICKDKKIITISRGGVGELYSFVPNTHINLLEFHSQSEWSEITSRIWRELGGLKQSHLVSEEIEILRGIKKETGIGTKGKTLVLHPSIMFSIFRPYWRNKNWEADVVGKYLEFPEYTQNEVEDYCAVKIYSRPSLSAKESATIAVENILRAEISPLKIVVSDSYEDDHKVITFDSIENAELIRIKEYEYNLREQFAVIGKSRACYTTYGGLSYYSLYLGKKSYGLYSDSSKFDQQHLKVAGILARKFGSELVLIQV